MARATIQGKEHEVRVVQDLTENWSVEVLLPLNSKKVNLNTRPFDPVPSMVIKVRADTREAALKAGLELLKQWKKIDDYVI